MSLSERHHWCVKKILEVFEPELESETVQSFIRNETNLNHFTSFFRGENSGRLFVFFQPVATEGDEGYSEGPTPKVLSISDGNEGVMMNKCCYFVRNVQAGVGLDLSKSGEPDLLFGELGDSALGSIEAILSQSYRPMLDTYDNWGKVDDEQKNDFVGEIGSFINNINEALNSFASGLELRSPDPTVPWRSNPIALPFPLRV